MQNIEFEINKDAVKQYFLTLRLIQDLSFAVLIILPILLLCLTVPLLMMFGRSFPVLPVLFAAWILLGIGISIGLTFFFLWLCPQQANNLHYRLEGDMVRADGGVFFLFRKSIPLERITDVNLIQGPIQRYLGIWAMQIQTAGSAQCEATLYGVREPEKVREQILAQRKNVYGEKTGDA
jgi:membrane protein YdbS with pleckstrin-like domain